MSSPAHPIQGGRDSSFTFKEDLEHGRCAFLNIKKGFGVNTVPFLSEPSRENPLQGLLEQKVTQ